MTNDADGAKWNYRPDVDGLRAIAVISVILFHIDKRLLPGGFVGVDIFFVISGFLISLNILGDLERGRFSIVDFYRRRVKRIAPPMLLVVAATMLVTQQLFLPEDAERTAESALWSLLSLANVYFWRNQDTSYFAAANSDTPLLHLWSLGVEEQFYIIWPLLLIVAYRPSRAKSFFVVATLIAMASFVLGEVWFDRDPSFVYFMLPTRAGELLLGALVAHAVLRNARAKVSVTVVAPMAFAGMVLLGLSLALLSEDQTFPGLRAVPPTLGTALLILAGHCRDNRVSRWLALKPLVWVGLISYSAYLWHWPLLALYRYGHTDVGAVAGLSMFALTLLLAWLTFLYVERPARRSGASAVRVFTLQYGVPAAALGIVALGAMYIDGYGIRWLATDYRTRLAALRQQTRPAYLYDYVCQRQKIMRTDAQNPKCVVGADTADPAVAILWGDSNAAHYVGMIGAFARKQGFKFRNLEVGSCPPIDSDPKDFVSSKRLPDCRDSYEIARETIDAFPVVMISASWTGYQQISEKFLGAFFDTATSLAAKGKLVILIGKAPVISGYDRRCREKALSYPLLLCSEGSVPPSADVLGVNELLKSFAGRTPNVEYFDVTPYLCTEGSCSAFDSSGSPLYYDSSHLTLPASWKLGADIVGRQGVPRPFSVIGDWVKGVEFVRAADPHSTATARKVTPE